MWWESWTHASENSIWKLTIAFLVQKFFVLQKWINRFNNLLPHQLSVQPPKRNPTMLMSSDCGIAHTASGFNQSTSESQYKSQHHYCSYKLHHTKHISSLSSIERQQII
jgi:hypothetical protein